MKKELNTAELNEIKSFCETIAREASNCGDLYQAKTHHIPTREHDSIPGYHENGIKPEEKNHESQEQEVDSSETAPDPENILQKVAGKKLPGARYALKIKAKRAA